MLPAKRLSLKFQTHTFNCLLNISTQMDVLMNISKFTKSNLQNFKARLNNPLLSPNLLYSKDFPVFVDGNLPK